MLIIKLVIRSAKIFLKELLIWKFKKKKLRKRSIIKKFNKNNRKLMMKNKGKKRLKMKELSNNNKILKNIN